MMVNKTAAEASERFRSGHHSASVLPILVRPPETATAPMTHQAGNHAGLVDEMTAQDAAILETLAKLKRQMKMLKKQRQKNLELVSPILPTEYIWKLVMIHKNLPSASLYSTNILMA